MPAAASLFAGAAAWLLLVQPNRTAPAPTPQATPAGPVSVAFEALAPGERCMAQAIYFEARGESIEGQLAVAQVVLNRTRDPHYPSDICGVVFQGSHHRHACQFSFACDGRSDRPRNMAAWARAVRLAKVVRSGPIRDLTEDATHYHADYVTPTWATQLMQTVTIGRHHFYREAAVN